MSPNARYDNDGKQDAYIPAVFTSNQDPSITITLNPAGKLVSASKRTGKGLPIKVVPADKNKNIFLTITPEDVDYDRLGELKADDVLTPPRVRNLREQRSLKANTERELQSCSTYKVIEISVYFDSYFCAAEGSFNEARDSVIAIIAAASQEYELFCKKLQYKDIFGKCTAGTDLMRTAVDGTVNSIADNNVLYVIITVQCLYFLLWIVRMVILSCAASLFLCCVCMCAHPFSVSLPHTIYARSGVFSTIISNGGTGVPSGDIVHFFSGKVYPNNARTIGQAWLNTVCWSGGYNTGINEMTSFTRNDYLLAHETGHNNGANHGTGIMGAQLCSTCNVDFSATSISEINSVVNTAACVQEQNPNGTPTTAAPTPSPPPGSCVDNNSWPGYYGTGYYTCSWLAGYGNKAGICFSYSIFRTQCPKTCGQC